MEQKETTTQNKSPQNKSPSSELSQETKNVTDTTPATPTSSWWGGLISQAKEKVNKNFPPHQDQILTS